MHATHRRLSAHHRSTAAAAAASFAVIFCHILAKAALQMSRKVNLLLGDYSSADFNG